MQQVVPLRTSGSGDSGNLGRQKRARPVTPSSPLTNDQLNLLIRAARSIGLDPAKLKNSNPCLFESSTAQSLQLAVSELDPKAAEEFQRGAGVELSLSDAAALAGMSDWEESTLTELSAARPATYAQLTGKREEEAAERAFGAFRQRQEGDEALAAQYG